MENQREKYYIELEEKISREFSGTESYLSPSVSIYHGNYKDLNKSKKRDTFLNFYMPDDNAKLSSLFIEYFINNSTTYKFKIADPHKRLLLLLGYPGQGKSTFCYQSMLWLFSQGSKYHDIVFLRLREVIRPNELIHNFKKYIQETTPYELDWNNAIIFLDGLDEITYLARKQSKDYALHLIREIDRVIDQTQGMRVILTSRLNYFDIEKIWLKNTLIARIERLNLDQQKRFLKIIEKNENNSWLTSEILDKINSSSHLSYIKEL